MILFSQAPADIQYVLSLYDKYKDSYNIKIIIVNVENNYKFFKSLNLNAKLEFIPVVSQKILFRYIIFLFELRGLYKELFSTIDNTKIYFFSKNYDYVTAFFIEKLYKNNKVFFVDIYKQNYIEKKSIINKIKKTIMYYSLGIEVYFNEYSYIYVLDKKINIIYLNILQKNIEKYIYRVKVQNLKKPNLLFYESDMVKYNWFTDYTRDLTNIMDKISKKYNIYVKPHPRLGYSKILNHYDITIIEDYIPSELLSLRDFDVLLGTESTAIASANFANKYSLVNLLEYSDLKRKPYIINYLKQQSHQNIIFVQSLQSLDKLV